MGMLSSVSPGQPGGVELRRDVRLVGPVWSWVPLLSDCPESLHP